MAAFRILIADDTPDVRLLLRTALRRSGRFEVVGEAGDGAEAIRLAAAQQPDAVVLDLAMPVMDGLQALPEIRRVAPETKVLVMSGFDRTGIREEAIARGAHAYVEKGRPLDEVGQMLAELCGEPPAAASGSGGVDGSAGAGGSAGEAGAPAATEPTISSELLSVLAHELSSPVAVINGFTAIMLRDPVRLSPEEITEYANAIARAGGQIEALINQFYDARYLAANDLPIERAPVDVEQLVRDAVSDLRTVTEPHPVNVASMPARAAVDPHRLRQVVEILLANAARFSPPQERIDVEVAPQDGAVVVAVRDRCRGIPAEQRHLLFQKFTRLREGVPGLGLGLYIARGIARAHDGDLTYESPRDGGCRFVLRLPA